MKVQGRPHTEVPPPAGTLPRKIDSETIDRVLQLRMDRLKEH
jgi:hypothetical protein